MMETFIKERDELKAKIAKLTSNLRETESRAERWLELTEKPSPLRAMHERSSFQVP